MNCDSVKNILELPNELLDEILSNLTNEELTRINSVSNRFYSLTQSLVNKRVLDLLKFYQYFDYSLNKGLDPYDAVNKMRIFLIKSSKNLYYFQK
jgi:hypothetical protein